jgi:formylglycine-generating enzyme required for sulfatase activity
MGPFVRCVSTVIVVAVAVTCLAIANQPDRQQTYTDKTTGMQFHRIKAGEFVMGSSREEQDAMAKKYHGGQRQDWMDDEKAHLVRLSKDCYLGVHEVTRGQFRKFVADSGYKTEVEANGRLSLALDEESGKFEEKEFSWLKPGFAQTDDHPVVWVTWNDAVSFCKWLSAKGHREYRLPTEAEWEFACRAGTRTRYSFGDDEESLAGYANVADGSARERFPDWNWAIRAKDGYVFTAPVGRYKSNGNGLKDMHGNVWEWCSDWYATYPTTEQSIDPRGPSEGSMRVDRGGSWGDRG